MSRKMKFKGLTLILLLTCFLCAGKVEGDVTSITSTSILDGFIQEPGGSWSGPNTNSDNISVGEYFDTPAYCDIRGFITFDLSSIPSGATITSATLELTTKATSGPGVFANKSNLILQHVDYTTNINSGTTNYEYSDYSNSTSGGSTVYYEDTAIILSSWPGNNVLVSVDSNIANTVHNELSKGRVDFRIVFAKENINSHYYIDLWSTESATASYRPRLVVEWTTNQFSGPTAFGTGVGYEDGGVPDAIVMGDIDNDGDFDLIVTGRENGGSRRLDKYINNGSGTFASNFFGTAVEYSSIALGDIDNDGDMDLIVAGYNGSYHLDKYINDGTGIFTGPTNFGVGVRYSSIAIGDIDNDGDLDLIVTGDDGSSPHLDKYINDGSGNFSGTNFGIGVYLSSIALGDIDNDGDLDFIVTGYDGVAYHLDKYINDGTGNFTGTNFGTGVQYSSIALGDIDNDGDIDLIVTGYDSGGGLRLDKYINDGKGIFTGPTAFGTGVRYSSVALGDIDNDGDLDLIVTGQDSGGSGRLDKYINDGSGTFTGASSFGTGVQYSSVALGDIDNNGDLDLIVTGDYFGAKSHLDKYINNEATVNNPPSVPASMSATNVGGYWRLYWNQATDDWTPQNILRYQIAIGTNSGIYDIASTNIDYPRGQANLGKVTVVTGTPYYQTKITNIKTIYWKVCAIDSAFKRSAYCTEQVATLHILNVTKATDVGGTFTEFSNQIVMVVSITDAWGDTLAGFQVGNAGTIAQPDITGVKLWFDTDKDNVLDSGEPLVANLEWDGSSLWTNNNISFSTSLSPARHFLVTVDLVSSVTEGAGFHAYIPANGVECNGGVQSPTNSLTNSGEVIVGQYIMAEQIGTGVQYSSIAFGDIDNDGDLDLIVTGSSRLDKYINDGSGNFTGTSFGTGVQYSSIALGDIDNDGDLDLIVTGNGAGLRLDKYINDGTGNFTGPTAFGTGVNNSSIALGDIDNDGDLDLIVTGEGNTSFRLDKYINDGTGNFSGTAFGTGVGYSSIALGDIDQDGDLDLIVTGTEGVLDHFDKYINDGSGSFSGPTSLGTGVSDSSIALGDIDNDGDLDLIVTGYPYRLDKYINDGTGNFTGTNFGTGVRRSSIAFGDIDNDGDLDLIVTGYPYRLDKYINDGTGNFTGTNFGTGVSYSSIAFGDIEQDGDLDLIVTGYAGSTYHLDKYINNETIVNNVPNIPTGMSASNVGGYWRLLWNQATDDHTLQDIIRYQIAIGTNSGVYDCVSTNIDYPRGQANIGKVTVVTGTPYYQIKKYAGRTIYWKVSALDSAFKHSAYCVEQSNTPPMPQSPNWVSAIVVGGDRIDLNWNDVNETSYTLFRNTVNDSNSAVSIAGISENVVNYSDTGLNSGTTYYYWIKAYNEVGSSGFSSVISNTTQPHTIDVSKVIDISGEFMMLTNQVVMVVSITDNCEHTLSAFSVGNGGSMSQSDVAGVKLWYDADKDNVLDTGEPLVADLGWDGSSLWTNNNISFSTSLSSARHFLVTVDLVSSVTENAGFQAYISVNGVKCSGGKQAPSAAISNSGEMIVGQYIMAEQFGTGVNESSIALGDIDNDGDLDLIVTGYDGSSYYLDKYINDGSGNFTGTSFGTGVYKSYIALGDIDNDGDLDLIVTGYDGSIRRLDKYINDGSGNFSGATSFGTGVSSSSIALGDVDNDGDLDLIVTGYGGGHRLDKYINDGTGNFSGTNFGRGVYWSSIALGDINWDGDLDLIVTGYDGSTYYLDKYINDGSGNFSGPTSFGTGVRYSSIALGDIDNDGDLDLIVTGYPYRLDKYINDGSGNFTGTSFGTGVRYSSIALGDIDNDGDIDLIVTGYDGSTYRLDKYINDGTGNFAGTNFGTGVDESSIALGDIDQDRDLDLIVTGWDGGFYHLDKYINDEATANNPPSVPAGMSADGSSGYWQLSWNQTTDDWTSQDMLRYQIAIGTNSGVYAYASTNIVYPRGQANLGNVCVVTGTYYQTSITNTKTIYWKVCAIDSAFKNSAYCAEQVAPLSVPPAPVWISAIPVATNQIDLLWNDVANETSYTLFRNTANDTNTAITVVGLSTNVTNYSDIGLSISTTYYYWLKAYNGIGASSFSTVISNTTFSPPPPPVSLIYLASNAITNNSNITFVWSKASNTGNGFTNYILQISTNNFISTNIEKIIVGINNTNFVTNIQEGTNWWRVHVKDKVGFSSVSEKWIVLLDTTSPTEPNLIAPMNNVITNNTMLQFVWNTGSDVGTGITNYILQISTNNFVTTNIEKALTNTNFITNVVEGSNYWRVFAQDKAGNISSTVVEWSVVVDITPPSTPNLVSPVSNSITNGTIFTFIWNASTDAVGLAHYIIEVDNTSSAFGNIEQSSNLTGTSQLFSLTEGTKYWRVRAYDLAGNISGYAVWPMTIDTTPPSAPVLSLPVDNTITNDATPTLVWNAVGDAVSYIIRIDGVSVATQSGTSYTPSTLGEGAHTWTVASIDNSDNVGSFATAYNLTIDTTPPNAPVLSFPVDNTITNDATPTLVWNAVGDAVSYIIRIDGVSVATQSGTNYTPSTLGEGVHTWTVASIDNADNVGSFATAYNLTIDLSGPAVVSLISPSSNSTVASVDITFTWGVPTDTYSGIGGYIFQVSENDSGFSSPTVISTNGTSVFLTGLTGGSTYYWRVKSYDDLGNTNNTWSSPFNVSIDTNQIVPTLWSPVNGTITNDNNPTYNWSDESGASQYVIEVRTNNVSGARVYSQSNVVGTNLTLGVLLDGQYIWRVKAYKTSTGLWQNWSGANDLIIDTVAPNAPVLSLPADNTITNDATPTLVWNTVGDAVSYIIRIDGVSVATQSGTNYMPSTLGEGVHTWTVRSIDSADNVGSYATAFNITIDTVAPNAPVLSLPADNTITNDATPTLVWNAVGDAVDYEISIDGGAGVSTGGLTSYTPGALSEGAHTWTVRSIDSADNVGSYATAFNVTIDITPPGIVSLNSPSSNSIVGSTTITFIWNATTDATTSVSNYEIEIDDDIGFGSVNYSHITNGTDYTVSGLVNSMTYYWRVRAYDVVGNTNTWSSVWSVSIDTNTTVPVMYSPTNGTVSSNSMPTFVWSLATGISSNEIVIDSATNRFGSTITNYTTLLTEGSHSWRVRVYKTGIGWQPFSSVYSYIVDTTAPIDPILLSPTNNSLVSSSNQTLVWNSVSDLNGISSYIVGVSNFSGVDFYTNTSTNAVVLFKEGLNKWFVFVRDKAGNESLGNNGMYISVDTIPPGSPVLLLPMNNSVVMSYSQMFEWNVSIDTGSGIDTYIFQLSSDNFISTNIEKVLLSTNFTTNVIEGTNWWRVYAEDKVGNKTVSSVWQVIKSHTAEAVVSLTAVAISSNRIRISWADVLYETGYKLYRSSISNTNSMVLIGRLSVGETNYIDNVTANSLYYYSVKSTNSYSESGYSAIVSSCSYAIGPQISSSKIIGNYYTNNVFIFTNKANIGAGGISGYYYVWDKAIGTSVTSSDSNWVPAGVGEVITNIAVSEGDWYLHIRSYNTEGILVYQEDYGAYKYYKNRVGAFELRKDKDRVDPDGVSYVMIENKSPILDANTGNVITDGTKFGVEVIGASVLEGVEETNGLSYVVSSNGDIHFRVKSSKVNNVKIRVYWLGDSSVYSEINVLFSYELSMEARNDAIPFNSIINPDKGEKLELYIKSEEGEHIRIKIFSIESMEEIKEMEVIGEGLTLVEWDLEISGEAIGDGYYGVLIEGDGWSKEVKFYVGRWFK